MRRPIALALALLCGCATRAPAPLSASESDRAREALAREFPRDANLYQLIAIDDESVPGRKMARFERVLPTDGAAVGRTRVAFCVSGDDAWRCQGPLPGVRIEVQGTPYSVLAPLDLDDATVVALVTYVGSECLAAQTDKLKLDWSRDLIRSLDRVGKSYSIQLAAPGGIYRLIVEPAPGASCPFELREVSALGDVGS